MLVTVILDTADNLLHIIGSKMSIQSRLASNTLQQLLLIVFSTETETNQIGCRQTTRPFW